MSKKPRTAPRARAGRGKHTRAIAPPLAGISHVEPCEYLLGDDLQRLAEGVGLRADGTNEELAKLAQHPNFAFSMGFVGQRRNDRATAATGEVLRHARGLQYTASQQLLILGFGETAGPEHRFSARRYLARAFSHDSTLEATRAVIRSIAERLGASPEASATELVRIIHDRAADLEAGLVILAERLSAIASKANRSKPSVDQAVADLFDDVMTAYEAANGMPFTAIVRHRRVSEDGRRTFIPSGPALAWVLDLFGLVAERATQRDVGANELAELAEWARAHPDGGAHAIRKAATRAKMQREML